MDAPAAAVERIAASARRRSTDGGDGGWELGEGACMSATRRPARRACVGTGSRWVLAACIALAAALSRVPAASAFSVASGPRLPVRRAHGASSRRGTGGLVCQVRDAERKRPRLQLREPQVPGEVLPPVRAVDAGSGHDLARATMLGVAGESGGHGPARGPTRGVLRVRGMHRHAGYEGPPRLKTLHARDPFHLRRLHGGLGEQREKAPMDCRSECS